MKAKIKVMLNSDAITVPSISTKGDWIDLRAAEDIVLPVPTSNQKHQVNNEKIRDVNVSNKLISLGIAIQLPAGYEAHVLPRSSSYKNFGIILGNSMGIIDNSYCGPDDIWKFNAIAIKPCTIKANDRICQFRIMLSQKATVWQKIKWLFTNGIEIQVVNELSNNNRGGIGSTGVK